MIATSSWLRLDVETPCLAVDIDTVTRNLVRMADVAKQFGVELLPHAKTHRIIEMGQLQVRHSSGGLSVAKLGEAEAFADAGVGRLFVAYPVVGFRKVSRALNLHSRVDIAFGADSIAGAEGLAEQFHAAGETAKVMLAVDTGLGREGVSPAGALRLADEMRGTPGLALTGIYTHEGSVAEATDHADLVTRSVQAAESMVTVAEMLRARGHEVPTVSMGCSASAAIVASVKGVTQIRPGIYAFNDLGQVALGSATRQECALRVMATVVSRPETERACVDAGTKSLGADLISATALRNVYPGYGELVNLPGWHLERLSEEHGWLRWRGNGEPTGLQVGSRVEIIPTHACMAFASLRRALIVQNAQVVEVWDTLGPGSSE